MAYQLKCNQRSVKIQEDYVFNVCGFQIKVHFIIWSWGAVYIQLMKTNNSKMGCLKLDPVLMLFFEIYSLVEDCVQKTDCNQRSLKWINLCFAIVNGIHIFLREIYCQSFQSLSISFVSDSSVVTHSPQYLCQHPYQGTYRPKNAPI